ncbi:MAG TPA: SPW repeat protein [Amycolatopsis sp.]|uniref:SPW repeat domain-containing protein n=1 Tax=Amycolatopsis sp. TaxID=37632 RepID=UPI002B499C18|nr:SPW repeat protein [Amycolatopsis sp.]HKS47979.1 SPW repeat protein [Amycolatopsis sp.]
MTTQASRQNQVEQSPRYARPAVPAVGVPDGVLLLAGLFLVLSPWVIASTGHFGLAASNTITGLALALLAVGFARSADRLRTLAWVTPVLGAWVIASPWAICRGSGLVPLTVPGALPLTTANWLSNVIAGVVVLAAGIGLTWNASRTR